MPNVVRFALSTARTLNVPGAGQFVEGVLDVDANNLTLVSRTRYLVRPYGATEVGIVDSATPKPSLPAVPVPPPADPYPMYLDPSEIFDSETGQIRTDKLPDRLSETELRAALVPRPTGGSNGQALVKSGTNVIWGDVAGGGSVAGPEATVYVTTTGDDTNDGLTPGQAKATIASALAAGVAAYPDGCTIQLGYGTFSADTFPIVIGPQHRGVTIRGCGMGQTYDFTNNVLNPAHATTIKNNTDTDTFQITGPTDLGPSGGAVQYGVTLEDFAIVGAAGTTGVGVNITKVPRIALRRLAIDQHGAWGLKAINAYWVVFEQIVCTRNGYAAATTPTGGMFLDYPTNLFGVRSCIFNSNAGVGAYLNGANAMSFYSCDFSRSTSTSWSASGRGVTTGGQNAHNYFGCWFESNAVRQYRPLTAGGSHLFFGCFFEGNGATPYAIAGVGSADSFSIVGGRSAGHSSGWSIDAGNNPPPAISWLGFICTDSAGFIQGPGNTASVNVPARGARGTGHYSTPEARSNRNQTLAAAGAVTIDASVGDIQAITLQANATSSSITNPTLNQNLTVIFLQDATGGRTYAWPTNCKFAGGAAPADTTASRQTSVTFRYDGTNWQELSRSVAVG